MKGQGLSSVALGVIQTLAQHQQPMSVEAIASILNEDEYEVEEVLENWLEFLQQQKVDGEIHYSFYHSNFRNWIFTNLSQG